MTREQSRRAATAIERTFNHWLTRCDPWTSSASEGGVSDPSPSRSFDFTGHTASQDVGTENLFRYITGLNPRFESLQVRVLDNVLVNALNLLVRSSSVTLTTLLITPQIIRIEGNPSVRLDCSSFTSLISLQCLVAVGSIPVH